MDDIAGESAREFFDNAPCGLLTTDGDGMILAVNQTFLNWTGYDAGSLVGKRRLDELFTVPCRIYYETHYAPLLRMQGFATEIATDLVCKSGRIIPAFLNSVEKRDAQGGVLAIRTAVFDGSDRRTYERELLLARRTSEQAVRAKADFLAMFAHEVRNPLGGIMLQVGIMERKGLAPEYQVPIGRLHRSLDRVLALINNMLDISKLEAAKVTLEETAFDLRDVIQAVLHTQLPFAERKALAVNLELSPNLPEQVRGDPVKLDQVLTNLVSNAIKFTEKGRVTIGAEQVETNGQVARLRLWVEDTGIGIPLERQGQVFEEYVQADTTVTRRFGGTGLGLAIAKRLLELQGSKLILKSEPNVGSTFSFDLRLQTVPAEAASA